MRRFDDEDLTGAEFRECDLSRARLVGVVMQDAEIDGLVTNLVVNGVQVMPYVEAELDRRHPVRLLIRSDEPSDLREAWRQMRADWATTTERVRSMPEGSEHRGVDGEWSMVETLRHLVFVHDSWFRRCVLGLTEPFTPMGLASPFVPDQEEQGLDPSSQPSLDEVLGVRDRQASELAAWLDVVTSEQLAQHRAGALRRRMAPVRQGASGSAMPWHRSQRGVGPPRFLRARPRQAVGSVGRLGGCRGDRLTQRGHPRLERRRQLLGAVVSGGLNDQIGFQDRHLLLIVRI